MGAYPPSADARRDLIEVGDARHERNSTFMAPQLPVEEFHRTGSGKGAIADAMLDRPVSFPLHFELKGGSVRRGLMPPPLDGGPDR